MRTTREMDAGDRLPRALANAFAMLTYIVSDYDGDDNKGDFGIVAALLHDALHGVRDSVEDAQQAFAEIEAMQAAKRKAEAA